MGIRSWQPNSTIRDEMDFWMAPNIAEIKVYCFLVDIVP